MNIASIKHNILSMLDVINKITNLQGIRAFVAVFLTLATQPSVNGYDRVSIKWLLL